ncbi:MAG: RelA/SpoT domain-containing protein [Clostridia bacterium]|nr:RelA/SpoT domain-containing protein [Clostridia bacterium]
MLTTDKELFLEYPDIEKILVTAPSFSAAIVRNIAAVKFLKGKVKKSEKWQTEAEKDEAIKLYDYFESYLERFYISYRDIMSREKIDENNEAKTTSVITPFFKKLPIEISKTLPHISFVFSGRFKSFHSFLEKAITILESRDENQLETYFDLHACKFKVSSYACPDHDTDYDSAEEECYELMNALITYLIEEENCIPMKAKYVGPTSEKIQKQFRMYVKDYISNPKKKGYRALHASFELNLNARKLFFEVQIVSRFMEAKNNAGDTAHHVHKRDSKIPLQINYDNVHYSDFEWNMMDPTAKPEDDAGIVQPKELSKSKFFRRII